MPTGYSPNNAHEARQLRRLTRYVPEPNTGCWLWLGAMAAQGYGLVNDGAKVYGAHRFMYEHHVGPIPEGLHLDHKCRVPLCVNPEHLEPVTCRENTMRGQSPLANRMRTGRCSNGHELSADNVRLEQQPKYVGRRCKQCRRDYNKTQKKGQE